MTMRDCFSAISAGKRANVPAQRTSRAMTITSEHGLLGAVLLDDAGVSRDDLLQGTTILLHPDQDICDCVHEAVASILGDDVRLLMHGTWFDSYDDAVNDGTPIVMVSFDRAVVFPQDAVLLADRVVDLGDVGRPEVVAALVETMTGAVVRLSSDEAASFEAASLMHCVHFAASAEDVTCRLTAWIEEHTTKDPAAYASAAPRAPCRTDLRV